MPRFTRYKRKKTDSGWTYDFTTQEQLLLCIIQHDDGIIAPQYATLALSGNDLMIIWKHDGRIEQAIYGTIDDISTMDLPIFQYGKMPKRRVLEDLLKVLNIHT